MAKIYNTKEHEVYWADSDVFCAVEDAYVELSDFIAAKKLDGHNEMDQWYMMVLLKLDELMSALTKCPRKEDLLYDKEIL